ncbi:hypothetical protein DIU31_031700 [Mucilaginibacter rubeus]|uniref:Uncharacterized protein n=1 Tax=Mucilaginibacter rubeus TaxID=2027860 RepID=A0AAE6JNK5_9SPHI|nr:MULTISPECIES: hypothetical protein [Mucilaginibacter]QEM07845.1 hypothetical protein DIU31_031700 [Mucilaginibacter rubeus]QEM20297.1 hypothetical protein DIU38_031305 [Mucilaginibacter gossypii]QTE42985.1 hypothetical protein J3L19_29360 [Mucilaginibacter rubeus]QTE49586.1 hypothetical protein J3L21_29320 [Mucilaginibacter rubeus]QTE54682.1 hypothetical protein J3L23_20945 [Mucilaginibacter rubeus]
MTWIKFISWLAALYAFYYLLNIAWDFFRNKKKGGNDAGPELHFEEATAPLQVVPETLEEKKVEPKKGSNEAAASALGGVRVKDLFQLAKLELIAYNQSVTF